MTDLKPRHTQRHEWKGIIGPKFGHYSLVECCTDVGHQLAGEAANVHTRGYLELARARLTLQQLMSATQKAGSGSSLSAAVRLAMEPSGPSARYLV